MFGERTLRSVVRLPHFCASARDPVEIRRSTDYIAFNRMSLGVNGCRPPRTRSLQHLGLSDRLFVIYRGFWQRTTQRSRS